MRWYKIWKIQLFPWSLFWKTFSKLGFFFLNGAPYFLVSECFELKKWTYNFFNKHYEEGFYWQKWESHNDGVKFENFRSSSFRKMPKVSLLLRRIKKTSQKKTKKNLEIHFRRLNTKIEKKKKS